ncbi:1,2-epoxyphenylacetyl-CoA isomerase [bacterium HR40]|nr:1,2-epoxyphenylacetyl-CoA isomerase [bacterium HR40]
MTEPAVLCAVEGGVAELTLNRPDRLNALDEAAHAALAHHLARIAADSSIRAVLLTGAGRGFCAGQDLSERLAREGSDAPDLGDTLERLYNPLVRSLRTLDKPVVCAVNGVAAGAGVSLALACDIVLAARSASFVLAFARIGLVPDSGATWFLPRLVGEARARALALLGEKVSAEQACAWGLVWKVVDDQRLLDEARTLARLLATGPTRAFALTKRALAATWDQPLDSQLALERDLQREAGQTADYREGVRAFLEKRPARFEGR